MGRAVRASLALLLLLLLFVLLSAVSCAPTATPGPLASPGTLPVPTDANPAEGGLLAPTPGLGPTPTASPALTASPARVEVITPRPITRAPTATASAPCERGANALCRDGTCSYQQRPEGSCAGHGGVARWLD